MIGGVTRGMFPHLSGVPHLHVNSPLDSKMTRSFERRIHVRFQNLAYHRFQCEQGLTQPFSVRPSGWKVPKSIPWCDLKSLSGLLILSNSVIT